nr:MAG TPA: hypothetical protein [Caudoviricetes sp.]
MVFGIIKKIEVAPRPKFATSIIHQHTEVLINPLYLPSV